MATGDQADIVNRQSSAFPAGWFQGLTPIRDGILNGSAAIGAWLYSLWVYIKLQTRIATASDGWLDIISWDFFGPTMPRNTNETDAAFSRRLRFNILPIRATRQGMINVLTFMTGYAPQISEGFRPIDTGAWSLLGGWSLLGSWGVPVGSAAAAYQAFITIIMKPQGIPSRSAWGSGFGGYSRPGIGSGGLVWSALTDMPGYVSQSALFAAINAFKTFGTLIWVTFQQTISTATGPNPPVPLPPIPAYTGAWGPTVNGATHFGLFAWTIPSAGAWRP